MSSMTWVVLGVLAVAAVALLTVRHADGWLGGRHAAKCDK